MLVVIALRLRVAPGMVDVQGLILQRQARLAACVNIVKGVRSVYRWEGKVEDDSEVLMIVKTQRTLFDQLQRKVKEHHSYSVPEIIALPIVEGLESYIKWLRDETG